MLLKILKYRCPSLYLLFARVCILSIEYFGDSDTKSSLIPFFKGEWNFFECDIDDTSGIEEVLLHLTERIAHTLHRSHLSIPSCEVESEAPIASFHASREYSSDFRCFSLRPRTVPGRRICESPVDDMSRIPHGIPDSSKRSIDDDRYSELSHKKKVSLGIICIFYSFPREFSHLHQCFHEF